MNFKKLVVTGATAALLLGSAAGAFAHRSNHNNGGDTTTSVQNNGSINNQSWNVANTGLNATGGEQEHSRHHKNSNNSVTTGDADAAQLTFNAINTSAGCGCDNNGKGDNTTSVQNNGSITNKSVNVANTGANYSGGKVNTGDAWAGQGVANVINTSVN